MLENVHYMIGQKEFNTNLANSETRIHAASYAQCCIQWWITCNGMWINVVNILVPGLCMIASPFILKQERQIPAPTTNKDQNRVRHTQSIFFGYCNLKLVTLINLMLVLIVRHIANVWWVFLLIPKFSIINQKGMALPQK